MPHDIVSLEGCEACYECGGSLAELLDTDIGFAAWLAAADWDEFVSSMALVYDASGFSGSPIYAYSEGGFEGDPTPEPWSDRFGGGVCGCKWVTGDSLITYYFNPTEFEGGCVGIHPDGIFNDIDLIDSATGFLTSPWNLSATDDMSLADNLGTGKVGIYYDVEEVEYSSDTWFGLFAVNVNLYHTIYSHADPIFDEWGLDGSTFITKVILADVENDGLQAKFGGGDEVDIEDSLEASINSLIEIIAATIVESQYTFKKIKQPTVDVRLFSAFEEGQKEETQTLSVTTTSTKTTY
tara:strand:+ start:183 stop:1067 length:885 start_codon:yes stop_codon:yes gene_type:complete